MTPQEKIRKLAVRAAEQIWDSDIAYESAIEITHASILEGVKLALAEPSDNLMHIFVSTWNAALHRGVRGRDAQNEGVRAMFNARLRELGVEE